VPTDCPDKAQQFASHGGDEFSLVFARRCQSPVAFMEPMLRLPGDLLDLFAGVLLPLA
jgi:hypothetical protein